MQVRFSTVLGLPVVDEEMTQQLGTISGIFVHPDTSKVEGFFVRIPGLFRPDDLFLSSLDVLRWGLRVVVRDAEVLSPIEDRIRLQSVYQEHRYVLGQRIITDTHRKLGICADVQFSTTHFTVEWIWPKTFWRWGTPLPVSQIIEVRRAAIVVRDPALPAVENEESAPVEAPLISLPETAA